MRRSLTLLVGLASFGSGLWLIASEPSRTAACTAGATNLVSGASNSCQSAAWIYFAGIVVVGLGIVVTGIALIMKRQEIRYRRHLDVPSDFSLGLSRSYAPAKPVSPRPLGIGEGPRTHP
jgi:hypothetical protein